MKKHTMIEDIKIPEVKNVTVAVVQDELAEDDWKVYLLNDNEFALENALVASKGYGENKGEEQKTSTLRHFIQTVPSKSSAVIEPINPSVFHLNNEYWVSYYIGERIYDKRFVFLPDSICNDNLTFIKLLDRKGILHS
ncbi:MAG: hypothetical protein RLN86_10665 [Cyclobacteriaceae bacterium]